MVTLVVMPLPVRPEEGFTATGLPRAFMYFTARENSVVLIAFPFGVGTSDASR